MKLLQSDECNVNEWAARGFFLFSIVTKFSFIYVSHMMNLKKGIDTNTFKVYGTVI